MTFEGIERSVNYKRVYCLANRLLVTSEAIKTFPFKVSEFLKEQADIKLCSFEKAFFRFGVPITNFGSESAVISEFRGAHIIFYNQNEPDYRIRFSIMHEFGHYILGHKYGLEAANPLYRIQELEANCFAAQMLMPEQLLRECKTRGKVLSVEYIADSFTVSENAAEKRRRTLARTDYEWKSREEKYYDDVIVFKYSSLINQIAPIDFGLYSFEYEYEKQRERDSWVADSRGRW